MTLVWRLTPPEFATDLSGEGSSATGGRWNSPGLAVVYASFNLSLCVLEAFVHLPPPLRVDLPEMTAVRIEIPDEASRLEIDLGQLPADLAGRETEERCRQLGDAWLSAREHLACTVPSMIVPQERNVMLNPAHRLMARARIVSNERFRFDPRLARGAGMTAAPSY
jgi:RES domain-containing protein